MTTTGAISRHPLFSLHSSISVRATPHEVYELISSLEKSSIWSPECRGGTWTGEPAKVGSIFHGENFRAEDIVGWAPLIRGSWVTEALILTAEPGMLFEWAMLTHTREKQSAIWGFFIEPVNATSCVLTHRFEMMEATEGIHHILADLNETQREQFVVEWTEKLRCDIEKTLHSIRDHLISITAPKTAGFLSYSVGEN